MKAFTFIATIILLFSKTSNASEGRLLLHCVFGIAPLEAIKVVETPRGLFILEKRLGYTYTARPLPETEWNERKLTLQDPEDEITGILHKAGKNIWNYQFTRSDGWKMTGGADCAEVNQSVD